MAFGQPHTAGHVLQLPSLSLKHINSVMLTISQSNVNKCRRLLYECPKRKTAVPFLGISAGTTMIWHGFEEKNALAMIVLGQMPAVVTKVVKCFLGKKVVTVVQHEGGTGKLSCWQRFFFAMVPEARKTSVWRGILRAIHLWPVISCTADPRPVFIPIESISETTPRPRFLACWRDRPTISRFQLTARRELRVLFRATFRTSRREPSHCFRQRIPVP